MITGLVSFALLVWGARGLTRRIAWRGWVQRPHRPRLLELVDKPRELPAARLEPDLTALPYTVEHRCRKAELALAREQERHRRTGAELEQARRCLRMLIEDARAKDRDIEKPDNLSPEIWTRY